MMHSVKFIAAVILLNAVSVTPVIAGPPLRDAGANSPAINLYSLEVVENAPDPLIMDRDYLRQRTHAEGFFTFEKLLQTSIEQSVDEYNKRAAILELAQFYAANDLYIEALAVFDEANLAKEDDFASSFRAFCNIKTGRFVNALQLLEKNSDDLRERALYSISMARLGGYKVAVGLPLVSKGELPTEIETLYAQNMLEAALHIDDQPLAEAVIDSFFQRKNQTKEIQFLRAYAAVTTQQEAQLKNIARTAKADLALRAQARLVLKDLEEKNRNPEDLFDEASALKLRWRGGIVEQELLQMHAEAAIAVGNLVDGLRSLRRLVADHSFADRAFVAQNRIMELLPQIASIDSGVPPTLAAKLVIEYSEFAPLGARGDELIRDLATHLSSLDLNREAASLLDHQVFERLRGANRSIVAAELARLHLLDGKPQESLRVIRTTRIAGLSDDVNASRRRVEAEALLTLGKAEGALHLLQGLHDPDDLVLKAKAYWALEDWKNAAASYASLFSGASGAREHYAMRAAVSFQLAADLDGFEAFRQSARVTIDGTPEMTLIDSLEGTHTSGQGFIQAYKAAFSEYETKS